jgi:hypothetical protein
MSDHVRTRSDDLSDEELGRIIMGGTIIGIPLVFVASALLTVHVGLVNALAIAVLPTLFSGSFVGGLILLMRSLRRAEREIALAAVRPPLPTRYPSGTGTSRFSRQG